jgi:nucleotide-binding universal stress UspA family protein
MRVQRILCPTDFSAKSDQALVYALALARVYEAKLIVFHSLRPSGTESNGEAKRQRTQARERVRSSSRTQSLPA